MLLSCADSRGATYLSAPLNPIIPFVLLCIPSYPLYPFVPYITLILFVPLHTLCTPLSPLYAFIPCLLSYLREIKLFRIFSFLYSGLCYLNRTLLFKSQPLFNHKCSHMTNDPQLNELAGSKRANNTPIAC